MKHLVIVSDLHINSTVGLCSNPVPLDDGGYYDPSRSQKWLHDKWVEFWNDVNGLRNSGDIITVINGDMVDNSKHSKHQLITQNISTIVSHAEDLLYYAKNLSDKIYVIKGTPSHVGEAGELENIIAKNINAIPASATGYSRWNIAVDVDGVLIDISHQGSIGSMPWNRTTPLHKLAASVAFESMRQKTKMPDLLIRSHRHLHADTHDSLPVRVIATPAWQLATDFVQKLGIVEMSDIGGLIISCDGGEYEVKKYLYKPEPRAPVIV